MNYLIELLGDLENVRDKLLGDLECSENNIEAYKEYKIKIELLGDIITKINNILGEELNKMCGEYLRRFGK